MSDHFKLHQDSERHSGNIGNISNSWNLISLDNNRLRYNTPKRSVVCSGNVYLASIPYKALDTVQYDIVLWWKQCSNNCSLTVSYYQHKVLNTLNETNMTKEMYC